MEIEFNEVIDTPTIDSIGIGTIFYFLDEVGNRYEEVYIKTDSNTYVNLKNGFEFLIRRDSYRTIHVCNNVKLTIS